MAANFMKLQRNKGYSAPKALFLAPSWRRAGPLTRTACQLRSTAIASSVVRATSYRAPAVVLGFEPCSSPP